MIEVFGFSSDECHIMFEDSGSNNRISQRHFFISSKRDRDIYNVSAYLKSV